MLAINFLIKVIKSMIIPVNNYEQKMIETGNNNEEIKNEDKWNYFHHFPILSLLATNHRLLLLYMGISFIWIEETSDLIN